MKPTFEPGILGLLFLALALMLAPLFIAQAAGLALLKLGIPVNWIPPLVLTILLGTFVNVPVWHWERQQTVLVVPRSLFGLSFHRARRAVVPFRQSVYLNLGGCIVPPRRECS